MIENSHQNSYPSAVRLGVPLLVFFGTVFLIVAAVKFHVVGAIHSDFVLARPMGMPVTCALLGVAAFVAARWFFGKPTQALSKKLLATLVVLLPLMGLFGVIEGAASDAAKPLGGTLGGLLARAFLGMGPMLAGAVFALLALFGAFLAQRILVQAPTLAIDPYTLLRRAQVKSPASTAAAAPTHTGDEGISEVRTVPGGGELFSEATELAAPPEDLVTEAGDVAVAEADVESDAGEMEAVEPFHVPDDEPPPPPRRIPILAGVVDEPSDDLVEEDEEIEPPARRPTSADLFSSVIAHEATEVAAQSITLDDDEDLETVDAPAASTEEEAHADASEPFRAEIPIARELTAEQAEATKPIELAELIEAASAPSEGTVAVHQPDLFGAGIWSTPTVAADPHDDEPLGTAVVETTASGADDSSVAVATSTAGAVLDSAPTFQPGAAHGDPEDAVEEIDETPSDVWSESEPEPEFVEVDHDEALVAELLADDEPATDVAANSAVEDEPTEQSAAREPVITAGHAEAETTVSPTAAVDAPAPAEDLSPVMSEGVAIEPESSTAAAASSEASDPGPDTAPKAARRSQPRKRRAHVADEDTTPLFAEPELPPEPVQDAEPAGGDAALAPQLVDGPASTAAAPPRTTRKRRTETDEWAQWDEGRAKPAKRAAKAPAPSPIETPASAASTEAARHRAGERPLFEGADDPNPDLLQRAIALVIEEDRCSVSMLQRSLGVTFGEATSLIDRMFQQGVVGPYQPTGRREVLARKTPQEQTAES